jgi:hypothetical protein
VHTATIADRGGLARRSVGMRLPVRVGPWYMQTLITILCVQNKVQLDAALAYRSQRGAAPLDPAALGEAAGVGVVVRAVSPRAKPYCASGARMHVLCMSSLGGGQAACKVA